MSPLLMKLLEAVLPLCVRAAARRLDGAKSPSDRQSIKESLRDELVKVVVQILKTVGEWIVEKVKAALAWLDRQIAKAWGGEPETAPSQPA